MRDSRTRTSANSAATKNPFRPTISATELQQTSGRLAQMSVAQAGQIGETMTTVGEIALSIERVSADGQESARVARQSLANARAGTEMVAEMIKGMNRIRERVQETVAKPSSEPK